MELKKFQKLSNPEEYDFKREIAVFKNDDEIYKYIFYNATGIRDNDIGGKEARNMGASLTSAVADTCYLIQNIYNKLWEDKYLEECKKSKNILSGDTMNSCNTTVDELFKFRAKECELKEDDVDSIRKIVKLYCNDRETFKRVIEPFESSIKAFLKMSYTLGNFIPCPVGCNRPRGTSFMVRDYWDLTLHYINKWYKDKPSDIYLYTIVQEKSNVEQYKKWLEKFKDWDEFVEKNYMQSFVSRYGEPKELWSGHFIGSPLPSEEKEIEEFFTNAAERISERSKKMVDALK